MSKALIDTDPMPFGRFKGTALANVPASYLRWVKENVYKNPSNEGLFKYIYENWDAISKELENEEKGKSGS